MRAAASIAIAIGLLLARPAGAQEEVWHAARTLQRGDVLQERDLEARPAPRRAADTVPASRDLEGMEMRRRVAAGRPITERDVGPRLAVRANAVVRMVWQSEAMRLEMTGRALEGGMPGDQVRVLNTATSRTVRGIVQEDGSVLAAGMP